MRQKRKIWLLGMFILTATVFTTEAQVTIGSSYPPVAGALLDLKEENVLGANSKKGLLMPRVTLTIVDDLNDVLNSGQMTGSYKTDHVGLAVYNISDVEPFCPGLYVWNEVQWVRLHGECTPVDPSTLPEGIGQINGRSCYDVMEQLDGRGCGNFTNRTSRKYDFSTGVKIDYVYQKPSGTIENVRYAFKNQDGYEIIKSVSGTESGDTYIISVEFDENLNASATNKHRSEALEGNIYLIYFDGTQNVAIKKSVDIQDCACCGAYIEPGVWLDAMCHNLGADDTADPFIPAINIHGARYQWGYPTAVLTQQEDQASSSGPGIWPAANYGEDDKWATDPCPEGWRVPTATEWQALIDNNAPTLTPASTWVPNTTDTGIAGIYLGDLLFLPTAGQRRGTNGFLTNRGEFCLYWSSTLGPAQSPYYFTATVSEGAKLGDSTDIRCGYPVRCIK